MHMKINYTSSCLCFVIQFEGYIGYNVLNDQSLLSCKVYHSLKALASYYYGILFFQNFSIIYITMGFPRLPREQQQTLAPALISAMENKPQGHQDQ